MPSRPLLDIALFLFALEHLGEAGEREAAGGEVDGDEPGADDVDEAVEEVGVGDAVDGGVEGEAGEEQVGYVPEAGGFQRLAGVRGGAAGQGSMAYRVVTLGIIFPPVRVSTRRMKGIMDKTLWWDEKGVSQWTVRLWTHTTRTGMLMGSTQSMRMRMECA